MINAMRLFHLVRDKDISGVSGTGIVAEGVEFTNGFVCLTWLTTHHSIVIYPNIKEVEAVHGHEGSTKIVWI
jgi:hypothetical protein